MTASQTEDIVYGKLNKVTGEWKEFEPGGRYQTRDQIEEAKKRYETRREREAKQALIEAHRANQRRTLGTFCFLNVIDVFTDVSPPTIPKIIVLASYAGFRRQLMLTLKTPMKRADIPKVLGLSRSGAYKFWREVKDRFFVEDEAHFVYLNTPNIFRSQIPKDLRGKHLQKVFIKTVRELYQQTDIRKHTQLGYVFQMLPYVNLEYNILCIDPFETQLQEVQPLTVKDLCNLIGYDSTQAKRLIRELASLRYSHNGRIEYLLSYVSNGAEAHESKKIFLNPHIVYNGSDYRRVETLGAFCRADTKISTLSGQADFTHLQQHGSVNYG